MNQFTRTMLCGGCPEWSEVKVTWVIELGLGAGKELVECSLVLGVVKGVSHIV